MCETYSSTESSYPYLYALPATTWTKWWRCQRSTSGTAGEVMLQADELTRPLYSSSSPQSIHFSTSSLLCSSLRLYLTVTRACRRCRLWPGDWGPLHTLFTRRPTRWAAIRTSTRRWFTWEDGKRKWGSRWIRPADPPPKNPPKSIWVLFSNQGSKSKCKLFLITKMKKYQFNCQIILFKKTKQNCKMLKILIQT